MDVPSVESELDASQARNSAHGSFNRARDECLNLFRGRAAKGGANDETWITEARQKLHREHGHAEDASQGEDGEQGNDGYWMPGSPDHGSVLMHLHLPRHRLVWVDPEGSG